MNKDIEKEIAGFRFRNVHPSVLFGTASDRYAGWIGQIYTKGLYESRIQSRSKTIGGNHFKEEVLPVESVKEYFEHFSCLEIDYTFYRSLLDGELKPTANYHALAAYKRYLEPGHRLLLKVPQEVFAERLMRKGQFEENPDYLNPQIFTDRFYAPACEILDENIEAFIFEQEYHSKKQSLPPESLVESLQKFFSAIPEDRRYHIELRTPSYLSAPYFGFLKAKGIGQVLSHWTWLPALSKQFEKAGKEFFSSDNLGIIRLVTPLRMNYDETYLKSFPFDAEIPGMMSPLMIDEAVEIIRQALVAQRRTCIAINNRSGGNAPIIAQQLARSIVNVRI